MKVTDRPRKVKYCKQIYFPSFSAAVQAARQSVEDAGYEINEADWFIRVNCGEGRPNPGKTSTAEVGLLFNGKAQRKMLCMQVYCRGYDIKNCYELNYYIS